VVHRRFSACVAVCALAIIAAGCGGSDNTSTGSGGSGQGKTVTITVGAAQSPSAAAVELGQQKGIFKRHGIALKMAPVATGAAGVAQLVNGQIQVALGGLSGVITASSQNIPVKFVSGGVSDHPDKAGTQYQTIVSTKSGITSFKDLSDKTVAVNSLKCCWEFWTREAVEKAGGNSKSLKMVQVPFPDQVAALKQGRVQAVTTLQPFATSLIGQGYKSIGDPAAIAYDNPDNTNTNFFMSDKFISGNPDAVKRWQAALQDASEYANAHPDETRKVIATLTKGAPDLIAKMPLPRYTAALDRKAIEDEAKFLVKYGVIKQAPAYDKLAWTGAS